jgi:hypothetical protein
MSVAENAAGELPADASPGESLVSEFPTGEFQSGEPVVSAPAFSEPATVEPAPPGTESVLVSDADAAAQPVVEPPPLFQSFTQPPPVRSPKRIPHLGHVFLLAGLLGISLVCTGVVFGLASLYLHMSPSALAHSSVTNVPLMLGSEALLYLFTFAFSLLIFPFFWHKKFFAGVQWRAAVAGKRFWVLAATALACTGLAALDEVLLPGPKNAPIDKMFSAPGAAWLMFAFGTTFAPFFEEMCFRGFLLPALCTAWDWTVEQIKHEPAPPLDSNGHPQWSLPAMAVASVLTSIPFALLHVEQQGHSLGPFLLLILISLILCTVRLKTRSLAASTLVHACYNFILFSLELVVTSGFRHFT